MFLSGISALDLGVRLFILTSGWGSPSWLGRKGYNDWIPGVGFSSLAKVSVPWREWQKLWRTILPSFLPPFFYIASLFACFNSHLVTVVGLMAPFHESREIHGLSFLGVFFQDFLFFLAMRMSLLWAGKGKGVRVLHISSNLQIGRWPVLLMLLFRRKSGGATFEAQNGFCYTSAFAGLLSAMRKNAGGGNAEVKEFTGVFLSFFLDAGI